jgi:hypothetical protein
MSEPSIKSLAERLAKALGEIDWMGRKPRPKLRKPASDDEIAAFEGERAVSLPDSYKEFLKIHNGMEGAEQYDWVVAGVTPVTAGESFTEARDGHISLYKQEDLNHPAVVGIDYRRRAACPAYRVGHGLRRVPTLRELPRVSRIRRGDLRGPRRHAVHVDDR